MVGTRTFFHGCLGCRTILTALTLTEYNSRYFEDPKEYKPSRWYDVSNESEAFTAFSIGNQALSSRDAWDG